MDLELRHLKVIRAIGDAGSLTAAATALGLAQPARSNPAQTHRTLGELVVARAAFLLPTVQELQQEAIRFAQGRHQRGATRFRLGGTHGPLLGGLVDRLAGAYPDTPVTTRTSWSERELAASVVDGRADFALVGVCRESPPPAADRLVWREIGVDPAFAMLAETHPLAGRTQVALGELADEAWAVVPGDSGAGGAGGGPVPRDVPHDAGDGGPAAGGGAIAVAARGGVARGRAGGGGAGQVVAAARAAHVDAVADSATYVAWRAAHPGFAEPLPA